MPNVHNKPVHEIRYGSVKAAVWKNETTSGPMFNVTVARLYKDGETWKRTSSFGHGDLLSLAKAANDAHSWIHDKRFPPRPAKGKRQDSAPASEQQGS